MKKVFGFILILLFTAPVFANEGESHEEESHDGGHEEGSFDAAGHAVHHALDAHEFHFTDGFVVPLPVILWTDNGLVTFMSSEFHHTDDGSVVVSKKGMNFVKVHEVIYQLEPGAHEAHMHDGHIENGSKVWLDFSLTKNVITIFLIGFVLMWMFLKSAKKYKTDEPTAPKGIAKWTEPLVLMVRDIAKENIEEGKYKKFTPYLLTVFFFILIGNALGLIPLLANPNVTGSISITLLLAMFTFGVQMIHSKGAFWGHIFAPPGVPKALYVILVPIEIAGIFIKPAALMIRLFANITAGHIIVVSLISIIFVNQSVAWSGLSVPMTLFISTLELLVAFLQAYIFTMLSALFIGMSVESAHH
jgi:F-type H+-transporting ATPase subunit a